MAFRKIQRKRNYRRRVVRRRINYKRRPRIPRLIGTPSSSFQKLKYVQLIQASIGASSYNANSFRLNSLFDPDATGTGGQPYYYDQLAGLYYKYRVFGCKISVKLSASASTTNLYHPHVVIAPFVSSAGWSSEQSVLTSPGAVYKIIIPGQNVVTLSKYFSIAKLMGISRKQVADDDEFAADYNANPAKVATATVRVVNNDGGTAVTVGYEIQIVYYCMMYQRTLPSAS